MVLSAVICTLIHQDQAHVPARYAGMLLFSWQVSKHAAVDFEAASAAADSIQRSRRGDIINANHPLPTRVSKGLLETTGLLSAETLIRSSSLIRERNVGK